MEHGYTHQNAFYMCMEFSRKIKKIVLKAKVSLFYCPYLMFLDVDVALIFFPFYPNSLTIK